MCLKKITRTLPEVTKDIVIGYKVYYLDATGKLIPIYWHPRKGSNADEPIPTNVWMKAVQKNVETYNPRRKYTCGFHVYRSLADARKGAKSSIYRPVSGKTIVPVLCRKITYYGTQDGCRVMIAREMFVPGPVEVEVKEDVPTY